MMNDYYSVKDNPLITIIIPVYNTAKFLKRCLDSVFEQTYTNWEALLIDDGSLDDSPAICDKYAADNRNIKVIHQKNGGLSAARNTGLNHMRGDFVIFLDSDDYIHTDLLRTCLDHMQKDNLDIVWFGSVFCTINEKKDNYLGLKPDMNTEECINHIYYNNDGNSSVCDKMFKSNIWKDIRFIEGTFLEDSIIMPVVLKKRPLMKSIENSFYYYCHDNENSILTKLNLKGYYYKFYVLKQWCEYFKNDDEEKYAMTVGKTIKQALKSFNMHLAYNYLSADQLQDIDKFLREFGAYKSNLSLEYRIYLFSYRHNRLINKIKAIEYKFKYK